MRESFGGNPDFHHNWSGTCIYVVLNRRLSRIDSYSGYKRGFHHIHQHSSFDSINPYLIFVISLTQAFCAVEIFYTQNALFVTKLNPHQNSVNRSNALCKIIHCGKILICCVKSPIQCKITCCGQNCTLNVWLHHENHTLSRTFCVNYTKFVKYMDHFHENFTPDRKNLHRHRLWCLWQIWSMYKPLP